MHIVQHSLGVCLNILPLYLFIIKIYTFEQWYDARRQDAAKAATRLLQHPNPHRPRPRDLA